MDGTAVARMVASIATSPTLSITASRIGPRSDRSPTLARSIRSVVMTKANLTAGTTIPAVPDRQVDSRSTRHGRLVRRYAPGSEDSGWVAACRRARGDRVAHAGATSDRDQRRHRWHR